MEVLEDDVTLLNGGEKAKSASKKLSSDKAALLSSGDEEEEDNGLFSGELLHTVNCDEGECISGSDTEISAYTGEQETYIGDSNNNIDQAGLSDVNEMDAPVDHVKKKNGKEATLIAINDGDFIDDNVTTDQKVDTGEENETPLLPNNSIISEIANKLKASHLSVGSGADLIRDQEYLDNLGFRESGSSCGYNSAENGSYSSSCDISHTRERKKKLRKRSGATERDDTIKNGVVISLDGDMSEIDSCSVKSTNSAIIENSLVRDRGSSKGSISQSDHDSRMGMVPSHTSFNGSCEDESDRSSKQTKRYHQVSTKDDTDDSNEEKKRINKSSSPSHTMMNGSKQESCQSKMSSNRGGRGRGRHRTRHKVYLDDPDVHQLINEHVILLQKFDNAHNRKFTKSVEDHELPNVGFVGHTHLQQAPYSVEPYGLHKSRGKDMVSRIRSDSYYSDEGEEGIFNNGAGGEGKPEIYEICPDCGDRHPPDEIIDEAEICPDCGVAHNPYQHTPSANKPWNKYVDTCRNSLKASKRYQQVSTEQDPDDVVEDPLPSIEGPHTVEELSDSVRYNMKYLGSSQIISHHPINKETRMQQAQDAYNRMKGDDNGEDEAAANVDMAISLDRIKIINKETKFEDIMMDHALRTVCFICDMDNVLVLMARRLTSDNSTDFTIEKGKPVSLGNIVGAQEKKTSKNICHVFETEDAQKIAKAIGQAFNIAYRNFLQSNGISHEHVEQAEYCHVLESQKLVGADLDRLTDEAAARDVVLNKKSGESLGLMLLESGWGSMLPTVFVAHIANYSVAARCQQLKVGDHILSCNGSSFVGMPLTECNNILKGTRSSNHVALRVVSCPPVVDVVISRPDVKYQLGFSVQNGTICSLLRGGIAERGGIRVGHRIIEINGDSVVAKSHQHIVDLLANTIGTIGMKTMPIAMYRLMVGEDQPQHV